MLFLSLSTKQSSSWQQLSLRLKTVTAPLDDTLVQVKKMVYDWCKSEEKLRAMRSMKKADRGLKAEWPELEDHLWAWILEQRAQSRGLSTAQLHLKVCTWAQETGAVAFAGGPSWWFRFMRCNRLSIRVRTTLCQKLPEDLAEKLENFKAFMKKQVDKNEISENHIVVTTETPVTRQRHQMLRWQSSRNRKAINKVTDLPKTGNEPSACNDFNFTSAGGGDWSPERVLLPSRGQAAIRIATATFIIRRAIQHLLPLRTFEMALEEKPQLSPPWKTS